MDKRYQIFISSTFADLEEERKEVMEAILDLDCFPAGMEMFPAADIEQFEYIKTIIDKSDYYVLVIAGRYGSVDESGISYTEKEFNYAKENGIPVLAFVKKDIESIPVGKTDNNPELKKKLDSFRKKAITNRLAEFWNNSEQLKYVVHKSLRKAFVISPRTGWVKADTVADIEALRKLEKLRENNDELIRELTTLKNQIGEKDIIENIAQGDDKVTIRYREVNSFIDEYRDSQKTISWDNLFSLIGPYFVKCENIFNSRILISSALARYMKKQSDIRINEDDFNTIKIQFDALDLIRYFSSKTTKGSIGEFMQLTDRGREKLKMLRTIKRENIKG